MPELPEVETLRRSLYPHLLGKRITALSVRDSRLRQPVDELVLQRGLIGHKVEEVWRRGKYLVVQCEQNRNLIIHLGMSGRLFLAKANEAAQLHEHVTFQLDDGKQLRFRDPRRFGLVDFCLQSRIDIEKAYLPFQNLGIEPLSAEFTGDYLFRLSRGAKKPIKNFLMDGSRLVGVGNIYACESLYVAKIHPQKPAGKINLLDWKRLAKAVQEVLQKAIKAGGTTLNDFQDANGDRGYFQVRLRVYGRKGEACHRCKEPIQCKVMAGRSTYYCKGCQKK
jgi:formamidopyrimidine-DNA glycosylase